MSGCLSFPCWVWAIVCEVRCSCNNLSFRGVCTLVCWAVWSVQWEAVLCNHLRLQNPVGCWGWLHVKPLHLCLWSLVNKRLLEAASSSDPAQISSDRPVPAWGGECCPPQLSFESHLCGAVVIFLLLLNFCSPVCTAEQLLTWCKEPRFHDEWGWYRYSACKMLWESSQWEALYQEVRSWSVNHCYAFSCQASQAEAMGLKFQVVPVFLNGLVKNFSLTIFVWVTMDKLHVSG